jgi:hypothetical protein
MFVKRIFAVLATIAMALASFWQFSPVLAATVSTPATQSVSSDSATGSSVSLPALVITETAAEDIPAATLSWTLPTGFVFDTASVANVVYTGTGLAGSSAVAFIGSTGFSITVTSTSTVAGSLSVGSVTPLKVKAASGTPIVAAGNIMLTAGTVTGIASTTSYGLLTQVPGSPSKLTFTVQPPATTTVGSVFSATVGVQDQFGNLATSDTGRNINILANLIASTTSGSLSGSLSHTDASGLAIFSGLSFSAANQISLTASSTGLTNTTSNIITISTAGSGTTTPPSRLCGLRNGILVKVAGNPTVYMVVNCVLRPFNTPAIFHAKGKKFQDIITIPSLLSIGREIGNGSDDDDTIVIPANSSSTLPSISGLPDGSIVKIPGNPTVYIVSGGVLKPFTSLTVFKAHKKNLKDVKIISASQFASMTVGDPVNFPDGTLVKGSDHTVYVVENGQLLGIPSMGVLNKNGLSLKNLLKASDNDLKDLKHGGDKD